MGIKRHVKITITLLFLWAGGYLYLMPDIEQTAPTLYLNGNFITVNPKS